MSCNFTLQRRFDTGKLDPTFEIFYLNFKDFSTVLCRIVFATHSVYLKPTMCACAPEGERSKTRNVTFFVFSPGDPPCEKAKMKDKITTLKTWRVFAWRPFRQAKTRQMEGENSPLINVSYLHLAGRKVATRNPATW